jgi:hypothetical protein
MQRQLTVEELPEQFQYWTPILKEHGDFWMGHYVFSQDEITSLSRAHTTLAKRTDLPVFWQWLFHDHSSKMELGNRVARLFAKFDLLTKEGVEPFVSSGLHMGQPERDLDWSKLPQDLAYAREPAEKYGGYQFDAKVQEFFENASDQQLKELREFTAKVRRQNDEPKFKEWIRSFRMTDHPESALVYFLFGLCKRLDE